MVTWDLTIYGDSLRDIVKETGLVEGKYIELTEHLSDNGEHWYSYAVRLGDYLMDHGKLAPQYKLWYDKDDKLVSIEPDGETEVNN